MRLVQLNGPHLIVTELSEVAGRLTEVQDPWQIEGIGALVSAMTGTAASPVIVSPPSLTPATAFVGEEVTVFPGIFTGANPTAVLRLNGVNVTDQIVQGRFTPGAPGTLSLTVTAPPLASISVSATISPLPVQPTAPAQFGNDDWTLGTGVSAGELVIDIAAMPTDGGSPISALQYQIDDGTWQTLGGTGTGVRTIDAGNPGEVVSVRIRPVNAIAPGAASEPKTAPTGTAPVIPAPTITRTMTGFTVTNAGSFPDYIFTRTPSGFTAEVA